MPYTSSSNYPSISMDEEVDRILESRETEFASSVDTTALCESEVDDCFDYDFHRKELQARRNERICINLALPESRTRSFEDWPTYGAAFLREGTFSQRFLTETPPKHTYAKKRHIEVTWQAGFREPVVSICSESPKTGNLVFCGEDSRETAKTGDGYFRAHALDCVNFRWSGDTECIVKWKPIKRALHKSQWDDNHCISEANRRRTARILQAVYVFHSGKVKSTTWDTSAGRLMTIALSRPRMYPNGRIAPHFDLRQESLGRMERNQQLAARDDLMSMAWRPACEESVPTFGTSILAELDPMTCRSSELHAVAALVNKADKMVNLDHLTTKDFQLVGESGSRARHLRPDCLWTDALAMNQVSKCDERRTLLREVAEMLRIFNGGGAEANTRDNNHLKALLPGSRVSIERSFAKAGILVFSPVCLHVSRNYAVSREFSPPANTTWFYQYIGDDIQDMFQEPSWLAHPDALLLLAASIVAGNLLTFYHQLNVEDKFQNWIVCVTVLASSAFGLLSGHTVVVTVLMVVWWSAYFGLIASDAFHTGIKLRSLPGKYSPADAEKQQAASTENETRKSET